MEARIRLTGNRRWNVALCCALGALGALLFMTPQASAANSVCPPSLEASIADKPDAIPHVNYAGVEELTYCYGPVAVKPGQNVIRFNATNLFPDEPGFITRFDPELVYADGSVPPVDVLHLHHAVWLVNHGSSNCSLSNLFNLVTATPQFAVGEEKTIQQLPSGFGWRSTATDCWYVNDMLHDLVAKPAQIYIVWRLDFVPDTAPAAGSINTVTTRWMDVAGNPSAYPVFDVLRSYGQNGRYTFPDQAPAADLGPCSLSGRLAESHGCLGNAQKWTNNGGPVTLVATAGHLHPGGLNTQLRVTRGAQTNTIFTSNAKYYEPAGAVSWDVAMGGTPSNWKVQLNSGDTLSVHTTYDSARADWYEVMGIMPVAVYNGTLPGNPDVKDAMAGDIPQNEVFTHGHLAENNNHGGEPTGAPDPLTLPTSIVPGDKITIKGFSYIGNLNAGWSVPAVSPGQSLTFQNDDADASTNAFHTITSCKSPCTGRTGVAYPLANGPVTFDSGELGQNGQGDSFPLIPAPAADRITWKTPANLQPGTYDYFCRIHPFMRGSFRVQNLNPCHGKKPTIVGTEGPDVLRGTKGRDVINGLGGKDKIIGLAGNDFICGGKGKDRLLGGKGKDQLYGGAGKDMLAGGAGKDRLVGGTGKDRLVGVTKKDTQRP